MSKRPEHISAPEDYYNASEARDYHDNSRIAQVQASLTERALQLLDLPADRRSYLLDIGCGSGRSGEVLDEAGHTWVGVDVSPDMLAVAADEGSEGDLIHSDMGHGLQFRSGTFDGAISISAVQWLCYCQRREHNARHRLANFFQSLYTVMHRGARVVIQLYPDNADQVRSGKRGRSAEDDEGREVGWVGGGGEEK